MAQVSKYPLNRDIQERVEQVFIDAIANLHTSKDTKEFLNEFLSPVEKIMLAKRLAIAILLSKGQTYPVIAEALHVTPSTIAQVSLQLKYSGQGYKKVVERLTRGKNVRDSFGKLEDIISSLEPNKMYDPDYILSAYEKRKRERKQPF